MLAQLHATGQLQSLLLKYMQAAYERMQQTVVQVMLLVVQAVIFIIRQISANMAHHHANRIYHKQTCWLVQPLLRAYFKFMLQPVP